MDMKLELVLLPVSDVDQAKDFYIKKVGFDLDVDTEPGPGFRVVQMTPPGSNCSVTIGTGILDAPPGSFAGMHLVVEDIVAVSDELQSRGVEVDEIHHFDAGGRQPGPHPERARYGSFASFKDPDGNTWVIQEVPPGD